MLKIVIFSYFLLFVKKIDAAAFCNAGADEKPGIILFGLKFSFFRSNVEGQHDS